MPLREMLVLLEKKILVLLVLMKKLSGKFCGKCPEDAGGQEEEQGPAAGPCCRGSKGNPQLHWMYCQVREVIFTSALLFQATPEVLFPLLGSSVQGTHGRNGESSKRGTKRNKSLENLFQSWD